MKTDITYTVTEKNKYLACSYSGKYYKCTTICLMSTRLMKIKQNNPHIYVLQSETSRLFEERIFCITF